MRATAHTDDLVRWRLRALGLTGDVSSTPNPDGDAGDTRASRRAEILAAVDRLLALQGQDWHASRWALGVRVPGSVDADVRSAFDEGDLVRSWPMRGTLHVMRASDLGWVQAVTNHRTLPGAAKRRAALGLDDATLARMTDLTGEALAGGHTLSRDELAEVWIAAGIPLQPAWRYHVVWWLSQIGLVVLGPTDGQGGEPRLALTSEWIRAPRALNGDEALAELARRYARGRGPVTVADFAWWTGLTMPESRRAFAAGAGAGADDGALVELAVDGTTYWAEGDLVETQAPPLSPESLLLPAFDEHLLGYRSRDAVLAPEHFERIVPGRNGMFRATVVREGRVIGVWTRAPRARSTTLTLEPFPGQRLDADDVAAAAGSWSRFHGQPVEVTVADPGA